MGIDTDYVFFERLILDPAQTAGIASFLAQTDGIAKAIIVALVLMSIATWYLIVTKTLQTLMTRRRTLQFLQFFWDAPSLQAVATRLEQQHPDEPFSHLTWHAIVAARHHQNHGANKLDAAGKHGKLVVRYSY
jgi:biopolymer transport protein ExbB